jgi:acyl-CoA thioester hydrolase
MSDPRRVRLKVRHYEVDAYGHVNHATYVHYLEVARIEGLEAIGLPLAVMQQQGYTIVVSEMLVRYHAPAQPGQTLEVVTEVREMRGVRSLWHQEIHDAATGRLVVSAEITGAFVRNDGRPTRIPPDFRERLEKLRAPAGKPGADGAAAPEIRAGPPAAGVAELL